MADIDIKGVPSQAWHSLARKLEEHVLDVPQVPQTRQSSCSVLARTRS